LSLKFEQAAPLPGDRIAALRAFHLAAIFTWVSLEPVLSRNTHWRSSKRPTNSSFCSRLAAPITWG
jgi:DNA repair photolyase